MILVIDNYDSFTYNLVQLLGVAGAEVEVRRSDAIDPAGLHALAPDAVVVSPGPSHPDSIPGVGAVVRHALDRGTPVLGVCLGHQVLCRLFGAEVGRAPVPVHGKPARIEHDGSGVFRALPTPLEAARYHSLAVVESTLPPDVVITARSEDGVVMGIRHASLPTEGIQFHPESILTPEGPAMLTNFVETTRALR